MLFKQRGIFLEDVLFEQHTFQRSMLSKAYFFARSIPGTGLLKREFVSLFTAFTGALATSSPWMPLSCMKTD